MIRPLVCSSLVLGLAACAAPTVGTPVPSATPSATVSATPSAAPSPQGFRLSGLVYDDDQAALAEVELSVTQNGQPIARSKSGADGKYALDVPAGAYVVTAAKPGYTHRSRSLTLTGDTTLNFGGQAPQGFQSAFLSTTPEVEDIKVTEEAPGKGLTAILTMSEPLTDLSRQNFIERLEIRTQDDALFLSPAGTAGAAVPETKWDDLGKTLTVRYAGPYLASGPQAVGYSFKLRQLDLGTVNSVTNEKDYEKLGISDAEGNALAFDRSDYIYYQPSSPEYLPYDLMADKNIAYTPQKRGWFLTHRGVFTHVATQDTEGPGIKEVVVVPGARLNAQPADAVRVRFSEPMQVMRSADEKEYTRLKEDERFVSLATATKADGSDAKQLDISPRRFVVDTQNPAWVTLYYPVDTFKDKRWFELALTDKALDPAGNKPNPASNRMSATIK